MTEPVTTLNASREARAGGFSGYLALLLMLAFLGYAIVSMVGVIEGGDNAAATDFMGLIGTLFLFFLLSAGF